MEMKLLLVGAKFEITISVRDFTNIYIFFL